MAIEIVKKSIEGSLCFTLVDLNETKLPAGGQIGFAEVIIG